MKMKQVSRFILFKITPDYKEVVLDTKGGRDSTWDDFVKTLPKDENRYVVYDFTYKTNDKPPRELDRLIFIYWSPDGSSIKDKTIYATNKEKFKGKISCTKEFQATDLSDLAESDISEALKK